MFLCSVNFLCDSSKTAKFTLVPLLLESHRFGISESTSQCGGWGDKICLKAVFAKNFRVIEFLALS